MTQDVGDVVDREAGAATSSLPLLHLPRTVPNVIGFAGVRTSDVSRGLSARRLMMLYSEDKAVIVIGALLALVASPVEVVQFIYVSLALDDAATDGSKASFSGSIGMLCILYAIAAAAVTLNLMLLQSVGHRVAARVRRSLVASVLRQEVSFLFGHNDDILQQTLTADVESIRKAVSSQLARWIQACVQVQLLHRPLSPSQPHNLSVCSGFRWRRAAFRFVVAAGPRPSLCPAHYRHRHGAASKFTANSHHPIIVSSCPKAMVFSVYSRSCASALAAAAAFADTLLGNCVLIRASGKQERETLHYSDLVSQVEIQQRRQALFAGT